MRKPDTVQMAYLSLSFNIAYALYNVAIGIVNFSWWYITLAAYYVVLSVMRFAVVLNCRENVKNRVSDIFVMRFTGWLFLFLSVILAGTTYLSMDSDRGVKHHKVVMITIALYSFIKITYAIIKLVKARVESSLYLKTLRNISFADALVSIFSLQRSMLISFGEMTQNDIAIFNSLTGTGVYLLVILLGINLIVSKNKVAKK